MAASPRQQIRVLHVDDNTEITKLTATFLQREDERFSVETANSAEEGLQLLDERPIDCVVSDYHMPRMNGIQFLKVAAEEYPDLPFILYTGKGSEDVASEAISAGVTDYLQKTSGSDDYTLLANRVRNAVDSQRREQRVQFLQTLANELTELALDFLRTEESDIGALIDDTLASIGTLVGADRTYVFDVDHEAETVTNTHEWCSEGVEPQREMLQDIPQETVPWWMEKLENFENITIPDVSALPPEAEAEQELLEGQGITSLVVTPMRSENRLAGFIGFDWTEEQAPWSEEFINILQLLGELITTARQRRERERELRELTDRLNLAVEGAELGVWDWEVQTGAVTFNEQWTEMLGLPPAEVEPTLETWEQRVHPDDIDEVRQALGAHLDGETEYYDAEHRMQTADGEWKWIRTVGRVAQRDGDGEPVRAVGIHIDITEQKEQQQELEKFETIIEALRDPVYVVDEAGQFTYVNDEFVELVGYDRDQILGASPSLIKGAEAVEQAERQLGQLLSSDGPKTAVFEVEIQPRTGDAVVCEDCMGVLPYEGETFNGSVGLLRNITERKQYERELEAKNERLEEFAGIVSHDLRNPLSVAQGRLEMVDATDQSDHLAKATDAVKRSQALIDDLLTLAREGRAVGEFEPVGLAELAENSWRTVETGPATLEIDATQTLRADEGRLQELVENLYRNALEHTDGDVTVSVGTLDDGFYVADTGPGIPEAERERIFEAGYSTNEQGTGFGLRIVEQVADAHGWEVAVDDSARGGARFEFTGVEVVDE